MFDSAPECMLYIFYVNRAYLKEIAEQVEVHGRGFDVIAFGLFVFGKGTFQVPHATLVMSPEITR